jgi:O-antigen ligase
VSAARSTAIDLRGGLRALPAIRATAPAVVAGTGIAVLALRSGGYYATTWSAATIAALAAAVFILVRRRSLALTGPAAAYVGGLVALIGWIVIESLRAGGATRGVPIAERAALYAAVAWAGVLAVRRAVVPLVLGGLLMPITAIACIGLAEFLLGPVRADEFEGRLLYEPLGYANACGILAAFGVLLALGFGIRTDGVRQRAAAAALVPLVVALELTHSRGSVLAGAIGGVTLLVLGEERLAGAAHTVVFSVLPLSGAVVAAGSRVADVGATTSLVARDGRLVAFLVVGLAAAQWFLTPWLRGVARHRGLQRVLLPALAALLLVAVAAVMVRGFGGLVGFRAAYWDAAWRDARAHPWLGSGPGSFGGEWLQRRTAATTVVNAHSLYLETLAELGPVGAALLVAALASPLVVALRRRSSWRSVACSAYVAFLVHAALDWDWQMPAVVVPTLLFGVCVLAGPRRVARHDRSSARQLSLVCSAAAAVAAAAAGIGTQSLAEASRLLNEHSLAAADRAAATAAAWQPWSAEPLRVRGEIAVAAGASGDARRLFAQAVRLDPNDVRTWFDLARVGSSAERHQALTRLARLDPLAVRTVEMRRTH